MSGPSTGGGSKHDECDEFCPPGCDGHGGALDDEDWCDDDDEPREPLPMYGCACENALVIDEVCGACIRWMAEQDRIAKERP